MLLWLLDASWLSFLQGRLRQVCFFVALFVWGFFERMTGICVSLYAAQSYVEDYSSNAGWVFCFTKSQQVLHSLNGEGWILRRTWGRRHVSISHPSRNGEGRGLLSINNTDSLWTLRLGVQQAFRIPCWITCGFGFGFINFLWVIIVPFCQKEWWLQNTAWSWVLTKQGRIDLQ